MRYNGTFACGSCGPDLILRRDQHTCARLEANLARSGICFSNFTMRVIVWERHVDGKGVKTDDRSLLCRGLYIVLRVDVKIPRVGMIG